MQTMDTFYKSREWEQLLRIIKQERTDADGQIICAYCGKPIVISGMSALSDMNPMMVNKYANTYRKALADNPDDIKLNTSIAMCYLKLKLYDQANAAFAKALEENFDNPEAFFYAAVALLKGKKAFVTPRADVDKAISYLNAANMIEPRGIQYYFLAYLKQDYYARKGLRTAPTYKDELMNAKRMGVPNADVNHLFALLEVPKPAELA